MKNYLELFNNNCQEAKKELLKDIDETLRDVAIISPTCGLGYIVEFSEYCVNLSGQDDFKVIVDFEKESKTYYIRAALKSNAISFNDTYLPIFNEYVAELDAIIAERDRQWKTVAEARAKEAKRLAEKREARKLAEEKARKEKEEAEKFEKRKANAIKKFSELCRQAKANNVSVDDEDLCIGWLAKHVTRISAEIPDFLESSFVKNFGPNVPKSIVSTDVKSSGGFVKKWSLSCQVHVDDLTTMPPVLREIFKDSKTVNKTSFALKLIYDYGFTFGKTQDLSQIKSMSSDSKAFDLGYSA